MDLAPTALDRPETADPRAAGAGPRRLSSAELLGESREVLIQHGDLLYQLRQTKSGKLLLTK